MGWWEFTKLNLAPGHPCHLEMGPPNGTLSQSLFRLLREDNKSGQVSCKYFFLLRSSRPEVYGNTPLATSESVAGLLVSFAFVS